MAVTLKLTVMHFTLNTELALVNIIMPYSAYNTELSELDRGISEGNDTCAATEIDAKCVEQQCVCGSGYTGDGINDCTSKFLRIRIMCVTVGSIYIICITEPTLNRVYKLPFQSAYVLATL